MRCTIAPEHSSRSAVELQTNCENVQAASMSSQRDIDRRNDARLLTPLLVMALVIAAGILFYTLTGHALAAV
jgi:hypothetical protein